MNYQSDKWKPIKERFEEMRAVYFEIMSVKKSHLHYGAWGEHFYLDRLDGEKTIIFTPEHLRSIRKFNKWLSTDSDSEVVI